MELIISGGICVALAMLLLIIAAAIGDAFR
jgi:hypothetical protein